MQEDQQTTEVRETNDQVGNTTIHRENIKQNNTAPSAVIFHRVVWYIAGIIIALLALRFIMFLLGANNSAGFVQFIYSITWVFAAPFYGIFPQPAYGRFGLDSASLVAIVIYALIAWGIAQLATLGRPRSEI